VGGDDGDDLVVAQFDGREDAAEDPGQLGLVLLRRELRTPGGHSTNRVVNSTNRVVNSQLLF
jgi:hypothetical protein